MFMFIINSSDCNYKEEIALHTSRHNEQSDTVLVLLNKTLHTSIIINKKIHNNTVKYQMKINRNENEHTIDRDTVYILINSS